MTNNTELDDFDENRGGEAEDAAVAQAVAAMHASLAESPLAHHIKVYAAVELALNLADLADADGGYVHEVLNEISLARDIAAGRISVDDINQAAAAGGKQALSADGYNTALMLLEMAWQGQNPEHGTAEDYAAAAHSILEEASGSTPSWDGAQAMLARIKAASAEELERPIAPGEFDQPQKINEAQAKTVFALSQVGGWGGTAAIENHGGNMSSATKLAADGLLERRRIVGKSGHNTFEYRVVEHGDNALINYLGANSTVFEDPAARPSPFHSAVD